MAFIAIFLFVLCILLNFVIQFYVARELFGSWNAAFLKGLRGNRVFIRGWVESAKLGIRPLMWAWSSVIVVLLISIVLIGISASGEDDQPNTSSSAPPVLNAPPPTTAVTLDWEVTSPVNGDVFSLAETGGTVPIIGRIEFNTQIFSYYQFWFSHASDGLNWTGLGDRVSIPKREPNSVLTEYPIWANGAGDWLIRLELVRSDGSRVVVNEGDYIQVTVVE